MASLLLSQERLSKARSTVCDSLVVIDAGVAQVSALVGDIASSQADVLLLSAEQDGVAQITKALQGRSQLSSLHIVSHGTPGSLHLGNTELSFETLGQYADAIANWSHHLKGQDILLYGCQVAKGAMGHLLLQQVQQLTGANIAASTARIGRVGASTNWTLDAQLGSVSTPIAFSEELQATYAGHFDPVVDFSLSTDTVIESEGTPLSFIFELSEAPPAGGTVVRFEADRPQAITQWDLFSLEFTGLAGLPEDISPNLDFSAFEVTIVEQRATIDLPIFNDFIDDSPDPYTWTISPISGGTVGNSTASVTIYDDPSEVPVAPPAVPEVNLSSDVTTLVEDEGAEVTFTIELSEPPTGAVLVNIDLGKPFALGDFDVFAPPPQASATGGQLVRANTDSSAFTFAVLEQTATITLPIFDDPDRTEDGATTDPDGPLRNDDIGEEQTTFSIVAGDGYTIGNNDSVTLTLKDTNQPPPPVNVAPEAGDDSYTTAFDTALNVNVNNGVLSTDTDADGDDLTAAIASGPSNGTVDLSDNGSFVYTPDAGFSGDDSFTYTADDGNGGTDEATVTVTVEAAPPPVNVAPEAGDDSYTTAFDTALNINANNGVLSTDTDADGDTLTAAIATGPSNGTVDLSDNGSFVYTPDAGFSGDDSFTYTAADGNGGTDEATVTVTVEAAPPPVNVAPEAGDDSYTTAFDTALNVNANNGVLSTDTDADGDDLTAAIASGPSNGTVELSDNGSFVYTPDAGFSGDDSFTYTADDGNGGTDEATVTVTVEEEPVPENVAPEAGDDSYTTAFDTALNINANNGVLSTDTDADGDDLTAAIATGPSNGTVDLSDNGSFVYTPDAGFSGDDSFTYTAADGNGGTDEATVTVTVEEEPVPENVAPEAGDDSYTTAFDTALSINANNGVLSTDTDADGDDLTAAIATGPSNGTVDLSDNGSFVYTPDAGFSGDDSFTYTAADGNGGTDEATVTVTVEEEPVPENVAPEAGDDSYTTAFDTALNINANNGVLSTDTDADGDDLTAAIATGPSNGTVNLSDNGSFVYTPDAGFSGDDSFTYTAADGNGGTDEATVTVAVEADITPPPPTNVAPEAGDDSYTTAFDTALSINANNGVLSTDTDADGDDLTAAIATGPSNGTVDLSDDGSFVYTPNAGFVGTDSFTYQASDGEENSNVATVNIAVAGDVTPVDPVVSFSVEPATISEADGTSLVMNFSVDGDIPAEGITVNLEGDAARILEQFTVAQTRFDFDADTIFYRFDRPFANGDDEPVADNDFVQGGVLELFGLEDGDPAENNSDEAAAGTGFLSNFSFTITEANASITIPVIDDILEEADQTFTYTLAEGDGYSVDPTANSGTFTVTDGVPPATAPTIGVTADQTLLVEDEQTALTITFNAEGDIPEEGVVVQLRGPIRSIAEFDINSENTNPREPGEIAGIDGVQVTGGSIVGSDNVAGSVFFRITDPTATIAVPVFDDDVAEGTENLTFELLNGEAYEVNGAASSFDIAIEDGGDVVNPPNPNLEATEGRDRLIGTDQNDVINALAGRDAVKAGGGDDTVDGGSGQDRLFGEAGNDSIVGGTEKDAIFGGDGNDVIDGGTGSDRLFGEAGDDIITASSGQDRVFGGDGNDTIDGGTGSDRIFGEAGDDIITGGSGSDRVFGEAGQDIILGGLGKDRIFGGGDRDVLLGDGGNDFLSGGDGDDVLMGVTGDDVLEGGAGADLFVFGTGDGSDVIKDFEAGTDRIALITGELAFEDLSITQRGDSTLLGVTDSGKTLAVLRNVQADTLTQSSFTTVDEVATVEQALTLL